MAKVTLVVPSVLNGGGGERRIEADAADLAGAFAAAAAEMGDGFRRKVLEPDGSPRALINVYVNGKNSKFSGGMGMKLSDGDEVYILPAVAGGAELTKRQLDRYSRQVMLDGIGYGGQLRLAASRACIVGMGGLGNPIAARLAAMGVGHLRIIDRDVVELSNLHRQVLFEEADVGKVKVEAAAARLRRMNSEVEVEPLAMSVNDANAAGAIEGCGVVIDALDSVNARYALNRACAEGGVPFVTGAAVGTSGQAFTVVPGETACYNCVLPGLDEDSMPKCSIEGVHPPILSLVGGIEAAEATRVLLGQRPSLAGRMLHIDLESLAFTSTGIARVDECPVCGAGASKAAPERGMVVEELCGRAGGKRTFSLTPPAGPEIDVAAVSAEARKRGFAVESLGERGLSMTAGGLSVSLMGSGSAVVVGTRDEGEAAELYRGLVGR